MEAYTLTVLRCHRFWKNPASVSKKTALLREAHRYFKDAGKRIFSLRATPGGRLDSKRS